MKSRLKFHLLSGLLACSLTMLFSCSPPLRQAEELLAKKKYAQAQTVLEKLQNEDPENLTAQALLGYSRFYTEGPLAALEELQPLQQKSPNALPVRQTIQKLNQELQKFDDLLRNPQTEALKTYVSQAPNAFLKSRAQWVLFKKLKASGSKKEAIKLAEILKQESQDPFIQQVLDWESLSQTVEERERILDRYPKSSLRPLWYWQILDSQAETPKANQLLIHFKEETEDDTLRAAILLRQGEYNLEKNPVVALNYFRTLLQNYPKHPKGRQLIYTIREKLGKYLSTADHQFLAQAAFDRYMYQTASGELQAAAPQDREGLYQLGIYARKAEYYPLARETFAGILRRFPRTREAGLASVQLAGMQRSNKAYNAALSQLRQIRSSYESNPEVYTEALWEEGIVYDFLNQAEKQAKVYKLLVEAAPKSPHAAEALWIAVWQTYLEGQTSEVVRLIEKYRKVFEGDELESRFLYWLARAQESLEQKEEAKKTYASLAEGPLIDYYTHRSRERLRVMLRGGEDQYATRKYLGYKPESRQLPGWAEAFKSRLESTTLSKEDWPEALQLFYLGQWHEFLRIAENSSNDRWQYLRGLLLNQAGDHYNAITQYRYKAKENEIFLPVAFPLAWFETMEQEALKYQMNPFLVAGLSWQESQYKPDIQSWVGATGLMQIMPSTAEQIAAQMGMKDYDLKDPETNIRMGTWYLNSTHKTFDGNSMFAVASYNAGAGPVLRWKKQFAHLPYDALAESIAYPETRDYVKKVFTAYWIYQTLYGKETQ